MNFNTFLGLDSFRKLADGTELSHKEHYGRIINALGYENVKKCVPFTLEEIKEAIKTDEHLNNLKMRKWDNAGGFNCVSGRCDLIHSQLTNLYRKIGVDSYSCSDGVCILKECARMMVEENEK